MTVPLYFDQNMPRPVAFALRARDVDVLLAIADGYDQRPDEQLLERAAALGRVLVSQDRDFTVITTRWSREGRHFAGVVRVPQRGMTIGAMVEQLEMLTKASDLADLEDQVFYLPLW